MSRHMEDFLDIRVRELMSDTEEHLMRSTQPYSVAGALRMMSRSRLRSAMFAAAIVLAVATVAMVWAAIALTGATEVLLAVKPAATLCVSAVFAVGALLCLVVHAHAERILRAAKRREILLLAGRRIAEQS